MPASPEHPSSVFADLGFDRPEAEHLSIRSLLMCAIETELDRRGLSQQQAAVQMKVRQPRVSDLRRGKIERFSIDALVTMLQCLGLQVTVAVRRPRERRARSRAH